MPLAFAHLDSLNTEQRRAEGDYALSGPFLVIASAGSGDIGTPVQMAYLAKVSLSIPRKCARRRQPTHATWTCLGGSTTGAFAMRKRCGRIGPRLKLQRNFESNGPRHVLRHVDRRRSSAL